jgi:hypothetical protein
MSPPDKAGHAAPKTIFQILAPFFATTRSMIPELIEMLLDPLPF